MASSSKSYDGLYFEAAAIVDDVRAGRARIKSLCFRSKQRNKQALFALVTESCKCYKMLHDALDAAQFFKAEKRVGETLAVVLAHELVSGRKPTCTPKLWDPIARNKTRICAEYTKLSVRAAAAAGPDASKRRAPLRYARVNTLVAGSVGACIAKVQALGFALTDAAADPPPEGPPAGAGQPAMCFGVDEHLDNVLIFPTGTNLVRTPLYKDGSLVLQDKASCVPAAVLAPPPGAHVLDACAAPGNKTTQLADLVGPTGKVYAFERDRRRSEVLIANLIKHRATNVCCECTDFLTVNPAKYADVEYALVDPSCSGSGILEEHEASVDDGESGAREGDKQRRLELLANFQCMILRHAMSFPSMRRVVYSTCSVDKEENEEVVRQVLEAEPAYRLVDRPLPTWPRRGLEEYSFCEHVIRADPHADRMHGFFVALFEKRAPSPK